MCVPACVLLIDLWSDWRCSLGNCLLGYSKILLFKTNVLCLYLCTLIFQQGGPVVDEILPPPPPDPPTESAWERGLRHAKEVNATFGGVSRISEPLPLGAQSVLHFSRSLPFAFQPINCVLYIPLETHSRGADIQGWVFL